MHPSSGVRRALPFLLLILPGLAACRGEDPRAPFTDSRIPPGLEHRFYPPQGWAWGLIKVGRRPAARYGVSSPAGAPSGQVLILTSYGEPAEAWFETARELNARGHVVWVLEPIGQGGSGRYALERDLGHAPSLDPDVAVLLSFPLKVARGQPLFVLASGDSAPVAIRAAALGLRAKGVILSAPLTDVGSADTQETARRMRRFGLGWLRADGSERWRREGPDDRGLGLTRDAARGAVRHTWQTANPDLRMGGPSWSWRAAFADEVEAARRAENGVRIKTLVLSGGASKAACGKIADCASVQLAGAGRDLHLADDSVRTAWLGEVVAFIAPDHAKLAPAPPRVTVDPEG